MIILIYLIYRTYFNYYNYYMENECLIICLGINTVLK